MDKNKKNKKPLRLSSEGRLQLRKNLGPDQVKRPVLGKKSKTIQIVFRKKTSSKNESGFNKRQSFNKPFAGKQTANKPYDKIQKFSKPVGPILTKSDVNKKIDQKKFESNKVGPKKIKKTLSRVDEMNRKVNIKTMLENVRNQIEN